MRYGCSKIFERLSHSLSALDFKRLLSDGRLCVRRVVLHYFDGKDLLRSVVKYRFVQDMGGSELLVSWQTWHVLQRLGKQKAACPVASLMEW